MSASPSQSPPPDEGPQNPAPQNRELAERVLLTMLYHHCIEKRLLPPAEPGIPLRHIYPEDWNFYFQHAYGQKYGPEGDQKKWKSENDDAEMLAYIGNVPRCMKEIAETTAALLEAERLLVPRAIEAVVKGDFEAAWTAVERDKKADMTLKGLVRAAFAVRERSRADCPEMCLFGLIGERGDGQYSLVNLLKIIAAHDARSKSPYLFRHPAIVREYEFFAYPPVEVEQEWLRWLSYLRILQRNLYIVSALACILDVYADIPSSHKPGVEEFSADGEDACYGCGATANAGASVVLMKCSGCHYASYCSKACQKRNWTEHGYFCRKWKAKRREMESKEEGASDATRAKKSAAE